MRKVIGVLTIVAAALGLAWGVMVRSSRGAVEVDAAQVRSAPFEVVLAVPGTYDVPVVDVSATAYVRLEQILVREGERVRRGQVVATLEAGELRAQVLEAAAATAGAERELAQHRAAARAAQHEAVRSAAMLRAARATLKAQRRGPDPAEVTQAEAAVEEVRLAREEARQRLEADLRLYDDGFIPRMQLEASRTRYGIAEARFRQAEANLDMVRAGPRPEAISVAEEVVRQAEAALRAAEARQAQAAAVVAAASAEVQRRTAGLTAARARLAQASLVAPLDGVVTRVHLQSGAALLPGVPILSLAADAGWVTAEVEEGEIGKVNVGQIARITGDAYPGRQFAGRVREIGNRVETRVDTRIIRVSIELLGPVSLRPGTAVDVDLILLHLSRALLAPVAAVMVDETGKTFTFVIVGGRARRREVRTAERNGQFVLVESGLRERELLAIAEPARLRDGIVVRIRSIR